MKDMDMTEGKLFKKIILFTIPVMLSGILQLLLYMLHSSVEEKNIISLY